MSAHHGRRQLRSKSQLSFEALEVRRLLASDWQNPGQRHDVSRDMVVSPLDALVGINRLNSRVPRTFPARPANSTEPYYDVDGNGVHSPLDILLVINLLNRRRPTVSVELTNDTGTGPGPSNDRRTTDVTVQGRVSLGRATSLWGRFEGDPSWNDLSAFLAADQTFKIPHADLIASLGGELADGLHSLQLQPRWGEGSASVGNEADLPIVYDTAAPQSNFDTRPNFQGSIVMQSPATIEIPLGERASALTLIPSEIELFDATFEASSDIPVPLSPRGVSLSSDGLSLLIDPPSNTSSISYRVKIGEGAIEDYAGNLNSAFEAFVKLHSDSSQSPLTFGERIDVASVQRIVKEFTFDLTSPDLFILAGYDADSSSQIDLFSPSGQSLHTWSTGPNGGQLAMGSDDRVLLTELGKYRLRVATPALNEVTVKALLGSMLPTVPASLALPGTLDWHEVDGFAIEVTNQDRIFFENQLSPQVLFQVELLTAYGKRLPGNINAEGDVVFDLPSAGRFIVLVKSFAESRPLSYDFRVHLTSTAFQPLNFDQYYERSLTTPGQQVVYTFPARSAQTYTLEYESQLTDVVLLTPNDARFNEQGDFPVVHSGNGSVRVAWNSSNAASASVRFRLTETQSVVIEPSPELVHVEPMKLGVTQRTIVADRERYEFTFDANTNDLFAFQQSDLSDFSGTYQLIALTGDVIEPTLNEAARVYRIPYSGLYRLRAYGGVGTELAFQWQPLFTATPLPVGGDVVGDLSNRSFVAYSFVATNERFFAYAKGVAGGLNWMVLDASGEVVSDLEFSEEQDIALTVGRSYSLIVQKVENVAATSFTFHRSQPTTASRTITLNENVAGTLSARGDQLILTLPLNVAQFVKLNSQLDLSRLKVQWLDFSRTDARIPRDIDPNLPDRAEMTRSYRILVQNVSAGPAAYSLQFVPTAPISNPPPFFVGFDEVNTGTVDSTASFVFGITEGSLFMFDWLLEDNPELNITLSGPGGLVVQQPSGDLPILRASSTGDIRVEIENFSGQPLPFSFRLISPDSAPSIARDTPQSATLIPFGTAFARVALTGPTELFLQTALAPDNSSTLLRRGSRTPLDTPYEQPYANLHFLPGEAFVSLANSTDASLTKRFTVVDVADIADYPLNTTLQMQTQPGVGYIVPFSVSVPGTILATGNFELFDEAGDFVIPSIEGRVYELAQAGKYRALVRSDSLSTSFEFHTQVVLSASASLGQPISGTVAKLGDVHRYSIDLTAGSPILLTLESVPSGFARWIAPNGEVIAPILSGTSILPVYVTGTYQLEYYAGMDGDKYELEINNLETALAISSGNHEGTMASGRVEIRRFVGTPNQLVALENLTAIDVQVYAVSRLGEPLVSESFLNRPMLRLPADGIAYILAELETGIAPVDFACAVDLVSSQNKVPTIGATMNGTLNAKWNGDSYAFEVTTPTWVRIAGSSSSEMMMSLEMADGSHLSSEAGFFELLLAGTYKLEIYNVSDSSIDYSATIDLLDQAPSVPVDQATTINRTSSYRLDVPAPGRYEVQLRNGANQLLSAENVLVSKVSGESLEFSSRGEFEEAGSYWLSMADSIQLTDLSYSVTIVPIATTRTTLAVGVLGEYNLGTSGLAEYEVTVPLSLGMRLVIDQVDLGASGKVEVFGWDSPHSEWLSMDALPTVMYAYSGSDTLRFRLSGSGMMRLRVVDINVAPALPLGSALSVELTPTRIAHTWLLTGNIGDTIDFLNDSQAERPAFWMIVNEYGNTTGDLVDQPLNLTLVNSQRYVLLIKSTQPLTTPISVPFRTVVR